MKARWKCFVCFAITCLLLSSNLRSQHLIEATYKGFKTAKQIKLYLTTLGLDVKNKKFNDVTFYSVTYKTLDVKGNETTASGAFYLPMTDSCNNFPLIAYDHGTIFDKTAVPSTGRLNNAGYAYAGFGYLVSMPDYLGLGKNAGVHPYMHAPTEATATIDLIRALRDFIDLDSVKQQENGQVFICGYSQGGHAAMATHKYIQDNRLKDEFKVVASAPLSGAFDLSKTQIDFMIDEDATYYASEFVPYILGSYQLAYGNVYKNYEDLYDYPYDSLVAAYLVENHKAWEWSENIPDNFYDFMQDSVLENVKADTTKETHPINVNLKANDVYNWKPEEPVRMVYCGMDSMVTPLNSLVAEKQMILLGAKDVKAIEIDPTKDHNGCYFPALFYAINWFDTMKDPCVILGINEENKKSFDLKLYPRVADRFVWLESNGRLMKFTIYDVTGNIVATEQSSSFKTRVNVSGFATGIYWIKVQGTNQTLTEKFIKL